MDNIGARTGRGGIASSQLIKESKLRQRQNILEESFDITKDPFAFKNQIGLIECRLCITTHPSSANYFTHSLAKKHQNNLKKYQILKQQNNSLTSPEIEVQRIQREILTSRRDLGLPEFILRVNRHPVNYSEGVFLEVKVPDIETGKKPSYRFVSSFEQSVEEVDHNYQYFVVAAPGYELIGVKIPARNIDLDLCEEFWSATSKIYCVQIFFEA